MYRVLLVEDEEIIRKGIRYSVPWEECGCSVVGEAENGAVGAVSESDVMLAEASKAIIVAFNTGVDQIAADNAKRDGVEIKQYDIIYDAIEDIERAMRGMRAPKYRDVDTGEVEVREVYKISSAGTIAGSLVTSGTIKRDGKVRVIRNGKQIADVKLANLKRFKDDVKEVACRVFNPLLPGLNMFLNNRDHRKITVIDGVDPKKRQMTGGGDEEDEEERIDFCVASVKKKDLKQ